MSLHYSRNFVAEWPSWKAAQTAEWPYFDSRFIWFYRQQVKEIRRRLLTGGLSGGIVVDDGASKYLEVIAEQEKEINFLKVRIEVRVLLLYVVAK